MRFLFVDQITDLQPGGMTRGFKKVTEKEGYVYNLDSDKKQFMPSLIGETLGQLAAWNVMQTIGFTHRPVAGIVDEARVFNPVFVGDTIDLFSKIDSIDESAVRYQAVASVNGQTVFEIDNALGPLLPMDDFIDAKLIREQFESLLSHEGAGLELSFPNLVPVSILPSFEVIEANQTQNTMQAQCVVSGTAPFFPDHFPKQPVLPLTILLEMISQLVPTFLHRLGFDCLYKIHSFRKIKMKAFVRPGDMVVTHLKLKDRTDSDLVLISQTEVSGKRVCVFEMIMRKQ